MHCHMKKNRIESCLANLDNLLIYIIFLISETFFGYISKKIYNRCMKLTYLCIKVCFYGY